MNVLMVTAWPPSLEAGGVSTVIRTLAGELAPAHRGMVLVQEWAAQRLNRSKAGGVDHYSLRMRLPFDSRKPLKGFLGWLRDLPATLLGLRRVLRDEKIDIVHLHFALPYQFYFRVFRLFGGPPYVVTLHGSDTANFTRWPRLEQILISWTLRGSERVIAVSQSLATLAAQTFRDIDDIECIHNGLMFSRSGDFKDTAAAGISGIALPAEFFLMVGNVTSPKAPDVAIKAWGRVLKLMPDLHLVMVGEARELWDECQRLIHELGCEDRVLMVGTLPRDAVLYLMRRATSLVFPSRREGLPMVLLEAGDARLPVICSDIAPVLEIVTHEETALVVPSEDPGALAEAVIRLAGDAELRLRIGRALEERVHAEFSAAKMAARYLDVYRMALAPPGHAAPDELAGPQG